MKKVQKIDVKKPLIETRKKVAAYARVSMETDRLKHSLSAQISYYSKLIQNNPEWEFKGVYSDYGISGTSTAKRPGFMEMMEECEKGNIDIILTKSIKRFARNTVDLLEVVRHLKSKGIEVRFENENINSLSGDGELMLSILASFAQEESRSISENVKWGTVKRFKQGIPNGRFNVFGYVWEGDKLVIVEEEAEIVRRIYSEYLSGKSRMQIEKMFAKEGITTRRGYRWVDSNIKVILRNITYTGNLLFQKEYVVDPITKKRKLNRGELPQYYVENTHEAIIPKETYDKVQIEMERRRLAGAIGNPAIPTTEMTGKIRCPHCGKNFQSSVRNLVNGKNKYWVCATRKAGHGNPCHTGDINDRLIKEIICEVLEIEEYDSKLFTKEIDHVDVIGKEKFIFYLTNGRIVEKPYRKIDRKKYFTEEVRAKISEQRKNKHNYHRKNPATPFTGLIECDRCGNSFNALKTTLKTGEKITYLSCRTKRSECPHNSIQEGTLKKLLCEVLELDEFDEKVMDEKIQRIYIADNKVRFKFKDSHEETKEYLEKKRGTPWTKERHEKQILQMHEYWKNEEHRKEASERMKKIRSEKKWSIRK
ncbi:recombinase family protein [Anaerococcus sp. AGMB00486]|uniref:Recombinase family protein n=1 Tax=Anaerococcus faecalis TaxID=2742993 RepID=A0ABX2NAF4_9FIRM|nr:recombinase family protein [Anaerococcus faecalis]NVF11663.1 recombinase family protein [Anaerococcus faecalis]